MPKRKLPEFKGPYASEFCVRLQTIRKKRGLTQEELALKLGVPKRKITYYEREAKNPTMQFVEAAAKALDVTPKDLIDSKSKIKIEEVPAVIKSLKPKIQKIAELPRKDQESIANILDALFVKNGIDISN